MFSFLAADLTTGRLRSELPLSIDSDLSRFMMDVGTGTVSLPVRDKACPRDWEDMTLPWRNLYVVIDDASGRIIWSGVPTNRSRNPAEETVSMPVVTLEAYMARRYVPTLSFMGYDQTSVIANRLARVCNDDNGIDLVLETDPSGVIRERKYYADEEGRVLARLQELSQVIDGFEWNIDVRWADAAQTRFEKVFTTGYHTIGTQTATPEAVFGMPGSITDAQYDELWSDDDAATHVVATGDGEGESKTTSDPVVDTVRESVGWPRLELRRSFSSVTSHTTINTHAASVAAEVFGGQQIISITTRTDTKPSLGDWNLGDSVGVKIDTDSLQLDEVWRVVGWHLSGQDYSVKPALARVRPAVTEG